MNADVQLNDGVLGCNLFAYCGNNPVMLIDSDGHLPFLVITAIIGAVVGAVAGGIIAYNNGYNVWAGIVIGAAGGALLGLGLGAAAGVVLAGSATASTPAVVAGAGAVINRAGNAIASVANKASTAIKKVGSGGSKGTSLYSGGTKAFEAAKNSGGKIIDYTISGKITNLVTKLPFVDHQVTWGRVSANFASKAKGIVNAYIYAPAYRGEDSIFWKYEMPALMNNPNVTEVVIHIFGD